MIELQKNALERDRKLEAREQVKMGQEDSTSKRRMEWERRYAGFLVCVNRQVVPDHLGLTRTRSYEEVYGKLPSGLTVRDPASCPWSPNSVCSVVDLNKLHIDRPEPGRTDIKVNGETLTMKGSGNLDLWTRSRAGAPVA